MTNTEDIDRKWYVKTIIKGCFALIFMIVLILVLAGRIDYWQGWVFGIVNTICVSIQTVVFFKRTGLAKERMRPGPGTKWWDKIFWGLYVPAYISIIVVASLDAGRFQWATELHFSVILVSYIFHLLSLLISSWAMWVNEFFSSTVRIQKDRGQVVVQDGPYRFVRHPGYVGGILMGATTPLILGSLWGLVPAGVMVFLLIVRTYLEDITLQRELEGYLDFTKKTRYRLLPGIW